MPEKCENCGATIGNLETPFVWEDQVVCRACHSKLNQPIVEIPYAAPRAAPPALPPQAPPVQTIEQTGKRWKLQMLLGALCAIVGTIFFCGGGANHSQTTSGLGFFALVAGIVWFISARVRAWWHHG